MRPVDDTALGKTPRIQPAGDDRLVQVARRRVVPRRPSEFPGSICVFVQTRTPAIPHHIG